MGTIVEKGDYLANTKSLLKEKINDLGGNIDNSTTFRNYAQELQDIYDNIPKTTGENTNLSLNTIKGKMNLGLKGDTKQDTTTGINLYDITNFTTATTIYGVTFTPVANGGIKMTGTATNNNSLEISFVTTLSGNYTIATIVDGTFTTSPQVIIRDSSSNLIYNNNMTQNTTNIKTFNNISATTSIVRIYFTSGTTFNCTLYTMLLSGTYTSSNLPNYEKYTRKYC